MKILSKNISEIITRILALSIQGISAREQHRNTNDFDRAIAAYNMLCAPYTYATDFVNSVDEWISEFLTRSMWQWYEQVGSSDLMHELSANHYCDTLPLMKRGSDGALVSTPEFERLLDVFEGCAW